MTTLYRRVLIESADLPMDKFPEGTVATHPDHWPVERCSCSRWESEGDARYDPDMVGWTALVPIEAEEVHPIAYGLLELDMHGRPDVNHDVTDPRPYRRTEYLTPWEEA